MRFVKTVVVVSALAGVVTGCGGSTEDESVGGTGVTNTRTPQRPRQPEAADCIIGSWVVRDVTDRVEYSDGAVVEANLDAVRSRFTYERDGTWSGTIHESTTTTRTKADGARNEWMLTRGGHVGGRYSVSGSVLKETDSESVGFIRTYVNDKLAVSKKDVPIWADDDSQVDCGDDALTITTRRTIEDDDGTTGQRTMVRTMKRVATPTREPPQATLEQGRQACALWSSGHWKQALKVAHPIRDADGPMEGLYRDMANSDTLGVDMVPQCDDPALAPN
jgi:hypothetical protein